MYLEKIFSPSELDILKSNALADVNINVELSDFKQNGFIIFGAGNLGHEVYTCIRSGLGLSPLYFVDNAKAGGSIDGIPIKGQDELYSAVNKYVILCSGKALEMFNFCNKLGNIIPILPGALRKFCFCPGEIGCHYSFFDKAEVYEAYTCLHEELSKNIFKDFILFHSTLIPNLANHYDKDSYFSLSLRSQINYSHMVDAGAFTGDTLKVWLENVPENMQKTYYAFEPNKDNFLHLSRYVSTLNKDKQEKIFLYNKGLSDYPACRKMTLDNVLSRIDIDSKSGQDVELVTIDSIFEDKCVTVIKADVEGFEKSVLSGAKEQIRKQRPSLIFSAYHYPQDIYSLILHINKIVEDYEYYLRLHLPYFGDVTLYAIPQN